MLENHKQGTLVQTDILGLLELELRLSFRFFLLLFMYCTIIYFYKSLSLENDELYFCKLQYYSLEI